VSESPHEWHPEVLPGAWARTASDLAARSALDGFYLAGGTGLALHTGHRRSVDLDLFGEAEFDSSALRDQLRDLAGLSKLETARGTLHLQLHGVKVSFLHYPYPLLFPRLSYGSLLVADPRDIACMKVEAIASRGTRRDFFDLYVAAQAYGLGSILDWFSTKYASVSYSRAHLLKSLAYFKDAEYDPQPDLLVPLDWATVTRFFLSEVPRLTRLAE
jgi:hypothetical protein